MWRLFPLIFIALQGLVYYTFIKFLKTTKIYKPSLRWWALVPFILFNGAFIFISLIWGRTFSPPDWFKVIGVYPFYIWMAATFFISIWLLIGKAIKLPFEIPLWLAKIFKPLREKINNLKEQKAVKQVDKSRRKFVRYATVGISTYAFGGAVYGMVKSDDYKIEHIDIKINNLPTELKGVTLTLISDIHAGMYMEEDEMRHYADVVNELNSDIVCIPGDFVNFQVDAIHPFNRAFRELKAKHGIYGALGNHDFFQDGEYVAKAINNESPVQILRNQHRKLTINGKDLFVLGVDDTISSGTKQNAIVLDYIDRMHAYLLKNEPTYEISPKLLLCHKPYAFDEIAARNIFDLTLSGHTHGGQVVPLKFGDFSLSFAATVSKYIEGHYKTGKSNMYVSRGIGCVGLPIRINCPPEVTKIKLV
ncbi:MAG TPA: metallophosphoesterase [Ignavibacteria bacterium]|nr:metallophosphoesterase [Ignavibacteria bacterium]